MVGSVHNQRFGLNNIYIGIVESLEDKYDRGVIKVRILPQDGEVPTSELPYAFPLLPKVLHVRPKKQETVLVFTLMSNAPHSQRFYIGPLISQWQKLNFEDGIEGIAGLNKSPLGKIEGLNTIRGAKGSIPEDEDIAVIGRKNTDIILGENDLEIRCGARLIRGKNADIKDKIAFNRTNPAFIKLQYYDEPLQANINDTPKKINNSINIVGEYVNILSTAGDVAPNIDAGNNINSKSDETEMMSPEMVKKMIETTHPLPFGDELLKFLMMFFKAFLSHTHNYNNLPTVPDMNIEELLNNYTAVEKNMKDKLLSKYIRIN